MKRILAIVLAVMIGGLNVAQANDGAAAQKKDPYEFLYLYSPY